MGARARTARSQPAGPSRLDRSELEQTFGFRLRQAWQEMERCFLDCFRDEKITPALYAILLLVDANPGCRPSDVCREIAITPANIVPYVDELVQRGLLLRESGADDRRIKLLTLTPDGRLYVRRLRALHEQVNAQFARKVGEAKLGDLTQLLSLITSD